MTNRRATGAFTDILDDGAGRELEDLLDTPIGASPSATTRARIDGVRIGTLVGFADSGAIPLVTYADQPMTAALRARTTLDLHASHLGRPAVMMFEDGDPHRPIVIGCLQQADAKALGEAPDHVEIEANGQRLIVSAQDQIVVRCGKASITLTKEGKVIVQGTYVSSQSSGVLRIRGGSVQIN